MLLSSIWWGGTAELIIPLVIAGCLLGWSVLTFLDEREKPGKP